MYFSNGHNRFTYYSSLKSAVSKLPLYVAYYDNFCNCHNKLTYYGGFNIFKTYYGGFKTATIGFYNVQTYYDSLNQPQ